MTEPMWNWECKVDRLRKILEKQALERTYEAVPTSASEHHSLCTANDVNEEAESHQTTSMSNVSEYLVNLINYSDFKEPDEETYRVSENSSGSPKSVETLEVTHSVSEVNASTDPENVPDMIKIQSMTNSSEVSTKDVECNTSDLQVLPECITNWIPVLQSAKSDFIHLIDDHIGAIRENANRIQSQHDEWILKLRMSQAKKIIKRKACIRRIRNELNNKTKNLNNLLDQLERI